jgi:predicted phage terminase large subunit-like protein
VAIQVWKQKEAQCYLLETINKRMTFVDTIEVLQNVCNNYHPESVLIEDKANGPAIISTLSQRIPGIVPITPKDSKSARLQSVIPMFIAGNVQIVDNSTNREFIAQLLDFPHGSHDDMVDACTQALQKMRYSDMQIIFINQSQDYDY